MSIKGVVTNCLKSHAPYCGKWSCREQQECKRESLGLQLLPRYFGWKKPPFAIDDLLNDGHEYFFPEIAAEKVLVIEGEHQSRISRVGSSTSDIKCPQKNCEVTNMTSEKQIKQAAFRKVVRVANRNC